MNVNFTGLHIAKDDATRRALADIVRSEPQTAFVLKDSFDKINAASKDSDAYFTAYSQGMPTKQYRFSLAGSNDQKGSNYYKNCVCANISNPGNSFEGFEKDLDSFYDAYKCALLKEDAQKTLNYILNKYV